MKAILEASNDFIMNQAKSVALPLNDIQEKVDLKLDIKRLQKLLDDMCNDPVQIIEKVILFYFILINCLYFSIDRD